MMLPDAWFTPRLHLGLGNPNSAGALFAMLLVSALAFCLGGGRRRAIGAVLTLGLGCAMAMTASRGAVVALAAGLAVLAAAGARSSADRWMLALVAAGVAGLFAASPAGKRIHAPGQDVSLATRWVVFSRVPAMIAAAPGGWGAGRSAAAYQNWFEPIGGVTQFKHMLSTHAIWLVGRPWPVRLLYVGAWAFALGWCAGTGRKWMARGPGMLDGLRRGRLFQPRGRAAVGMGAAICLAAGDDGEPGAGRALSLAESIRRDGGGNPFAPGRAVPARAALAKRATPPGRSGRGGNPGGSPQRTVSVAAQGAITGCIGQQIRFHPPPHATVEYAWEPGGTLHGDTLPLMGAESEIRLASGATLRKVVWASPERVLPWKLPAPLRRAQIIALSGALATLTVAPWHKYFTEGGAGGLKVIPRQGDFLSDPWDRLLAEAGLDAR
ncbi:MAG: hypothetical protein PHC88_13065 [Terrimicrobiaceae bacterium]|nr:hypothetical protein [Terrimicrobiaceae bacterium]